MRLLIITQKVDANDPILGFFHAWIALFAEHAEHVHVICLEEGKHNLPSNVQVHSLGKEQGYSRVTYVWRFYNYIWKLRKEYNSVFVHMNQVYVILGGLLWRLWGKRLGLWYVHKQVSLSLRIAEKYVDAIFTASEKSFRLPSKKVHIVGHGIDLTLFAPAAHKIGNKKTGILTTGRIAPVKNIHQLVKGCALLKRRGKEIALTIVGAPITQEDTAYMNELIEMVKREGVENDSVFVGSVPNTQMPSLYQNADVFINLSETGSVDKAVLEAMACNIRVVTSNEAFQNILPAEAFLETVSPEVLAASIEDVISTKHPMYRKIVEEKYSLTALIPRILGVFENHGK